MKIIKFHMPKIHCSRLLEIEFVAGVKSSVKNAVRKNCKTIRSLQTRTVVEHKENYDT